MSLFSELTLWPYGLAMSYALAALIALSLVMSLSTQRVSAGLVLRSLACAVPLGLVGARMTWCLIHYSQYVLGAPENILKIGDGGLSLWGGLVFGVAAVGLSCRRKEARLGALLDVLTPGMLVMIAILRWAEPLSGQGTGKVIQAQWLNLPFFAVTDEYGFARFAVWRYEAVAALAVALFVLMRRKDHQRPGHMFVSAMSEVAALQLVFESLRDDDYLHISFVRVSQILVALILLGLLINELRRVRSAKALMPIALYVLGGGVVVMQEFAVDSLNNLELNYCVMLFGALMVCLSVLMAQRMNDKASRKRKRHTGKRGTR